MKKSRKKIVLTCIDCGKSINGGAHLSRHVRLEHNYSSYEEYKLKYNLMKSNSDLKNEGAVECGICGLLSHDLTSHIIRTHNMKIVDYKMQYGEIKSQKYLFNLSERVKGENNPGYKHDGKFSPFSDKFIYSDKIDKNELISKVKKTIKENGSNSTTIEYWLKRGFTEEESRKNVSERQRTFTLQKCINKYGEEIGTKIWVERQEKWQKNLRKSLSGGFSKISQELFWEIFEKLSDVSQIYFAQLDENKRKDLTGKNHEYRLKLKTRIVLPDFLDIKSKKIIEFDGTYWHEEKIITNPNKLREEERDELLEKEGYKVLHIKEKDYKNNPKKIISMCLDFLNE